LSIRRRLIGSFGATILGPALTVLIQIIIVPVMLRFWGSQLYGEWLLLSTLPTYLLLTDMGFGNVAGSEMTMRFHSGDTEGTIEIFQSTQILVLLTSVAVLLLLLPIIFFVPYDRLLHLSALSLNEARMTLLLLSVNCLVMLQLGTIMSGYRCTGRYALGTMYVNCVRVIEGLSILAVLFFKAGTIRVAAAMLMVSVIGIIWLIIQHRRLMPWLHFGVSHARWAQIRALARPAAAFMAIPASNAITTQGMTTLVGLMMNPVAVAVFNSMRTLSRVVLQISNAVSNSAWPELSAAFGQKNWLLARKLHRSACQAALVLAGCAFLVLAVIGPRFFTMWTHHRLVMDVPAFYLLLASTMTYTFWSVSSSALLAANRHQRMALLYLFCTSASVAIGALLIRRFELRGAAVAMLLCDLAMSTYVLQASMKLLSDEWSEFAASMFDLTQFHAIRAKFMRFRA